MFDGDAGGRSRNDYHDNGNELSTTIPSDNTTFFKTWGI